MLAMPEVQEQMKYNVCHVMPKQGLRECVEHLGSFFRLWDRVRWRIVQWRGGRGLRPGPWVLMFGAKPCRRITSFNIFLFPLERVQPCSYPESEGSHRQNHRVCSYQDSLRSSLDAGRTPKSKYVGLWWPGCAIMHLVSNCLLRLYVCNPNICQSL